MQLRVDPTGLFDARYAAFLATVTHLRAELHRYCTRMTGSALDGEDVMQESLFEAYRKIEMLDDPSGLRPWLFRITHNRCIDFLRNRKARVRAEANYAEDEDEIALPADPMGAGTARAMERLVIHLPPKERASVLLKDIFDHSLEEIADLVDSSVGGVKSALSRGRTKLAALPAEPMAVRERQPDPELAKLLARYVDLFNRRDWDGVRALTSADAKLRVADCFRGRLVDSPYFVEYERVDAQWKMEVGEVDGEPVAIVFNDRDGSWKPAHAVRIRAVGEVIHEITDYYACPWLLRAAESVRPTRLGEGA
jgi:RNA polymerase sigma-70 factor, ECF subfamily